MITNIKVAVCDDEQKCRLNLTELLKNYSDDVIFEIDEFSDGSELIESSFMDYSIIFLDIEMSKVSGMEVAEFLHKANSSAIIFFVTNYDAYISQAIRNNAFQFLKKPIVAEDLYIDLLRAINELRRRVDYIKIEWGGSQKNITIIDICYVVSDNKKVKFVLDNGTEYQCTAKLVDVSKKLSLFNFVICHKSFLVNLAKVKSIDGSSVLLTTGERVSMSKKFRQEFKKSYNFYLNGVSL